MTDAKTAEAPTTPLQPVVAAPPAPKPALVGGGRISPIVPSDFESAYRLATVISASGMAPKSYGNNINMITVAVLHGLEVGLTPMAALQSIAVINGMPTIWGDGMLALVRASGLLEAIEETFDEDEDGPTIATCRVKRRGEAWTMQSFTRPEAIRAGLWKKTGPWAQYPRRMMQMRSRSWALRDAFADVLRGMGSAEEMQDMVDVTSSGSATTAPPAPTRAQFRDPPIEDQQTPSSSPTSYPANDEERGQPADPPAEAGGGDSKPEVAAGQPVRSWRLADDIVGQEAKLKAILDLLEITESVRDVNDLASEHGAFLDKLGATLKSNTRRAFEERRIALSHEGTGE